MSRKLRRALAAIDGVEEFDSAFQDDVGYWVNGEEIAHFKRRPSSSSWSRRQRRPIGRSRHHRGSAAGAGSIDPR